MLSTGFQYSMGRNLFVIKSKIFFRNYSNSTNLNQDIKGIYTKNPLDNDKDMVVYDDAFGFKNVILEESKGKSGIYMFTNKKTNDFYIGQSKNLYNRFRNYYNPAYITGLNDKNSRIGRAIIKYGYENFSLTILEYCDKSILTEREQFYFDTLKPVYNILKTAGVYVDVFTHTDDTKTKISNALKGVNAGENSYWYGRSRSEETKQKMSLKQAGENNALFGKTHSDETKELMRQFKKNKKSNIK